MHVLHSVQVKAFAAPAFGFVAYCRPRQTFLITWTMHASTN